MFSSVLGKQKCEKTHLFVLSVLRSELSAHLLLSEGLMKTEAVTLLRWGFCVLRNSTVLSFGSQMAAWGSFYCQAQGNHQEQPGAFSLVFRTDTSWKVEHSLV